MSTFTVTGGLDLGLFSAQAAAADFYQDLVGLPFVETLRHSPSYEERFYSMGGSSLKINLTTDTMPPGRSGYCGLTLARAGLTEAVRLVDPDGLPVTLVPGDGDAAEFGIQCEVADVETQARFLRDGLGAREVPGGGFQVGNAVISLTRSATAAPASPTWSTGFNYVVAFVDDILAARQGLLELGAEHSVPATRLADRCVFAWLRDPSGNWLELVQPARTGTQLPQVTPIDQRWQEIIAWRETGQAFE